MPQISLQRDWVFSVSQGWNQDATQIYLHSGGSGEESASISDHWQNSAACCCRIEVSLSCSCLCLVPGDPTIYLVLNSSCFESLVFLYLCQGKGSSNWIKPISVRFHNIFTTPEGKPIAIIQLFLILSLLRCLATTSLLLSLWIYLIRIFYINRITCHMWGSFLAQFLSFICIVASCYFYWVSYIILCYWVRFEFLKRALGFTLNTLVNLELIWYFWGLLLVFISKVQSSL